MYQNWKKKLIIDVISPVQLLNHPIVDVVFLVGILDPQKSRG